MQGAFVIGAAIASDLARGSHNCLGGCGRLVSNNKRKCLSCMAIEARDNLAKQGVEADEDDLARMILTEAGV